MGSGNASLLALRGRSLFPWRFDVATNRWVAINELDRRTRTPWYPDSVKPLRPGVYEARFRSTSENVVMLFWDGANWKHMSIGRLAPSIFGTTKSGEWRGLAQKPE